MLYLYPEKTDNLRWNGEPLFEASKAEITETLNGAYELKVTYPMTDSKIYQQLTVDKLISAPSPSHGHQFFRIKTISEENDNLQIRCSHISDDIMHRRIRPLTLNGIDCQTAVNQMVAKSRSKLTGFHFDSDISAPHVFTTEEEGTLYSVFMDGAHSILGTWEGDLIRNNRQLSIKSSRGQDRGEILSTHHSLYDYHRELDSWAVYTRIIARSTFHPEGSQEERRLEVVVDSPLIGRYPYINEVAYENNNLTSEEDLRKWAMAKFEHEHIDKPKDSLVVKAHLIDGMTIHLSDTVHIKSDKHQADFQKKVIAYTWDALTKTYLDFTFDDRVQYGGVSTSPLSHFAKEILHGADEGLSQVRAEMEAANRRFDIKELQLREEIEDGILRAEAKAEEHITEIADEVTRLDAAARQLESSHQAQDKKILEHFQVLGETTDLAQLAKDSAVSALTLARETQAQASANLTRLTQAISDLNNLSQSLTSSQTELLQIKNKADSLLSKANGLETKVNGFQTKLDTTNQSLSTKADKIVVDGINKTVSTHTVDIKKALDGLSSKVSMTDYNAISQTVASHTTKLSQTATTLETLAKKSDMNQLSGRLTTAENSLRTTAENVTQMMSSSLTAAAKLLKLETEISKQAGEINQRLTSTQVESAIAGKGYQTKNQVDSNITSRGYQTKSQVDINITGRGYQTKAQVDSNITGRNYVTTTNLDNRLTETVRGYTREISRVESLLPQGVGGRNYIRNYGDSLALGHSNNTSEWSIVAQNDSTAASGKFMVATCTKAGRGGFHKPLLDLRGSRYANKPMTFSFEIRASRTVSMTLGAEIFDNNSQAFQVTTGWKRFVHSSIVKLKTFYSFVWYIREGDWAVGDKVYIRDLQLEDGLLASTPQPALEDRPTLAQVQKVESTVDSHSRTFTQLGTLPTSLKWSSIQQTLDKVTTTIGDATAISKTVQTALVSLQVFKDLQTGLSSQQSLTANHYALKFLKASGDVLTQLNVNSGGVKIQGKLIHLDGQTLIDNGVIKSAMIYSLDAGKISTGYLSAARIATQAITGDKIKFDQAFFDKMTANEVYFKTIFGKSAFITAVQAVTLSASKIVGGLLSATNKAMIINLNQANITFNSTATIDFNSSWNALRRKVGDVTGFLHFNTATAGGTYVGLGVTSHNEGIKSQDTGRFAGIRIFRSNDSNDQLELYGDIMYLGHAFNGNALRLTATRLDKTYEMVDIISSIKALWRCWLHFNNVRWNPSDNNLGRAVINEYNAHNIG